MTRDLPPSLTSFAAVQQCSAKSASDCVCGKIIPTGAASRQVHLVPFIHCAHCNSAAKGHYKHRLATKAACVANGSRKHRKNQSVHQLVPRWRDQAHGHRLGTANKEAERQTNGQANRCPLDIAL
jgi:hypothetical protein